jgi:hypothetical protein
MRVREAIREAWRDVASGSTASGSCALVLAVLLAAVVGIRAGALADDVRAAHARIAAGAATVVVTADGRIDGAACDALVAIPSVRAAGAIRADDADATPASLPRSAVPSFAVSSGFPALLSRDGAADTAGVVISRQVADELGLQAGDRLATTRGDVPVASVFDYPDDGRDPELGYSLLAAAIDDGRPFDACWATVWPHDVMAGAAARGAVLRATGVEDEARVTTGLLNPRLGDRFEPNAAEVDVFVSAGLAAGVGLVIGVAAVLRRRLVVASDRHVGVPRSAQVVTAMVTHAIWATVGAGAAFAATVMLVRGLDGGDAWPILMESSLLLGLGALSAVFGGVIGLALVRERSLHRYFRGR